MQAKLPRAVSARHYDRRIDRVLIRLSTGLDVGLSPRDAEGLDKATSAQLNPIEISPSGFGIHFPKLDADLYLPALLEVDFSVRGNGWRRASGAQGGEGREARRRHWQPSASTAAPGAGPRKADFKAAVARRKIY